MKVWEGDTMYHETAFVGQGIGTQTPLWYEVVFETPYSYTNSFWGTATNENCYFYYNEAEDTIKLSRIAGYTAELTREK
jgi:hypothetical protein